MDTRTHMPNIAIVATYSRKLNWIWGATVSQRMMRYRSMQSKTPMSDQVRFTPSLRGELRTSLQQLNIDFCCGNIDFRCGQDEWTFLEEF